MISYVPERCGTFEQALQALRERSNFDSLSPALQDRLLAFLVGVYSWPVAAPFLRKLDFLNQTLNRIFNAVEEGKPSKAFAKLIEAEREEQELIKKFTPKTKTETPWGVATPKPSAVPASEADFASGTAEAKDESITTNIPTPEQAAVLDTALKSQRIQQLTPPPEEIAEVSAPEELGSGTAEEYEALTKALEEEPKEKVDVIEGLTSKMEDINMELDGLHKYMQSSTFKTLSETDKKRAKSRVNKLQHQLDHLQQAVERGSTEGEEGLTKTESLSKSVLAIGDNSMEKQGKKFDHFKHEDGTGGVWELDKKEGKIVRRPKLSQISSQDALKQAVKEGGFWDYCEGEQAYLDTEAGFVPVTISKRLPNRHYEVLSKEASYTVHERELFDADLAEGLYND